MQPKTATIDDQALLGVLSAVAAGDFSVRFRSKGGNVERNIANKLNRIIELNQSTAQAFGKLSVDVGKEGRTDRRCKLDDAGGSWAETAAAVNSLIDDLVQPTAEVARVIGAVAQGDLSQTMALDIDGRPLRGEFRRTARLVNSMVKQLGSLPPR